MKVTEKLFCIPSRFVTKIFELGKYAEKHGLGECFLEQELKKWLEREEIFTININLKLNKED